MYGVKKYCKFCFLFLLNLVFKLFWLVNYFGFAECRYGNTTNRSHWWYPKSQVGPWEDQVFIASIDGSSESDKWYFIFSWTFVWLTVSNFLSSASKLDDKRNLILPANHTFQVPLLLIEQLFILFWPPCSLLTGHKIGYQARTTNKLHTSTP